MKCSQCKEKLTEYIEGNLSTQVDEEIREHLEKCESCKRIYEKEVLEYEAFKAVFSTEKINFESITSKVMESIDQNKYSNKVKKRQSRYIAPIAAALFICFAISPFALNYINDGMGNGKTTAENASLEPFDSKLRSRSEGSEAQKYNADIAMEEAEEYEDTKDSGQTSEKANYVDLYSITTVIDPIIENNTSYISTENGTYEATIAGKGEYAQEEGIGTIYVKNNDSSEIQEIKLRGIDNQITPLAINWYDNSNLMIIQGDAYGTLANGIEIIVINVESSEQMIIAAEQPSSKISYEKVYREGNALVIEVKKYTDDILNEFVNEEIRIDDYKLGDIVR